MRDVSPDRPGFKQALGDSPGMPADATAAFVGEKVRRSKGLPSKGLILPYFCLSSRACMRNLRASRNSARLRKMIFRDQNWGVWGVTRSTQFWSGIFSQIASGIARMGPRHYVRPPEAGPHNILI